MKRTFVFLFFLFGTTICFAQLQLEIAAGKYQREQTPIIFSLPEANSSLTEFSLQHKKTKQLIPVQQIGENQYLFLLNEPLKKNKKRKYLVQQGSTGKKSPVQLNQTAESLALSIDNQPVFTYQIATAKPSSGQPDYYQRSGFIHPLHSPSGKTLTDDFPQGHTHQHALFMAWVNTTFQGRKTDFWNQQDQSGTVRHKGIRSLKSGSQAAQFSAVLEHLALQPDAVPIVVLEERWDVTVYPFTDYYLFDILSTQENVSADTLFINDYHYGGMAFRGSKEWNKADSLHFTNEMQVMSSEGITDRSKANHSRPNWVDAFGEIDGKPTGIAIFGHPANFNAPQPVRIHPDMPYFCFSPMLDHAFFIAPGAEYVSRYRFLVHDGKPEKDLLEQIWNDYANPVEVQVTNK